MNRNISNIEYNYLNLPSKVTFTDGSTIEYVYAADGTKLRTVHTIGDTTTTRDYCGDVIYENGVRKYLLTEEGYVTLADNQYHYYLRDHQRNNRVVVASDGTVEETNHYYPFGGLFAGSSSIQSYKYNGKEYDDAKGLNWYDYGARMYDPALGRFTTLDPLADKDYLSSPYGYCGSNPVIRIDQDGKIWDTVWDLANVIYDAGAAVVNHIQGNHETARSHWLDMGIDMFAMAIPFVPAGSSKIVKAADKGMDLVQTTKSIDKIENTNHINSVMKNRVKLQKGTKKAVRDMAPKTEDGRFIDPNTLQPIEKGQEVFGHKYGYEWHQYKKDPINQNKTRKEVISDQNNPDIYQIEDKKSNASHKFEKKDWK